MKLHRRAFISMSAISGVAILENSWSKTPLELLDSYKFAVQQGFTNETSSEFSILHWKYQKIEVAVLENESLLHQPRWVQVVERPDSEYQVIKVFFDNLTLGRKYQLIMSDSSGQIVDERSFKTLDLSLPNPKIAVISCMNDYFHRKKMWKSVTEASPDILFVVGDSVYADHISRIERRAADPRQLWERNVVARNKVSAYKMKNLIPTLAVWDDHDFGSNNSNRLYPYVNETLDNFLTFFAQSDFHSQLNKGPGLSMKLSAFGKDFYFLDGRSFRSANDESEQTVFGAEQESWLFSNLQSSSNPAWLITGSQWFGGYLEKEAYEYSHPDSFKAFLKNLRSTGAKVQFVAGDVHFSELMKIESEILGYETLEITSSSLHSLTFPGWHLIKRNPRRLKATSNHNFNLIQFKNHNNLDSEIRCIGAGNYLYYQLGYSEGE